MRTVYSGGDRDLDPAPPVRGLVREVRRHDDVGRNVTEEVYVDWWSPAWDVEPLRD